MSNLHHNQDIESTLVALSAKELTRVPQPLTDQNLMATTFGTLGYLVRDILIFLSNKQSENIFGELTFDMNEFCNKMGYERTRMQRKLSDADIKAILGGNREIPVYQNASGSQKIETVFELSLYLATERNFVFPRSIIEKDGTYKTAFTSIKILDQFDINCKFNTGRREKKTYHVKVSGIIKDYFLTNYNLIELMDYRNLPNANKYRDFYLILSRIRLIIQDKVQKNQDGIYISKVDDLAKAFECKHTRNNDRKRAVGENLDKVNNALEVGKFEWKFVNYNGSKYKYFVEFRFSEETLKYFDEKTKAVFFAALYGACRNLYMAKFFPELSIREREAKFNELSMMVNEKGFLEERDRFWNWFNSEDDSEEKNALYNKVCYECFGVFPEDISFDLS